MFGFIRDTPTPPAYSRGPGDFLPGPLRLVESPPSPLPRQTLYWLTALVALGAAWLVLGRLDIVAVAAGKLAPRTSLKIVQPADAGRVAEIAVGEGESVLGGQLLLRLDPDLHEAETRALRNELSQRTLQLAEELPARVPRLEVPPPQLENAVPAPELGAGHQGFAEQDG